MKLLDTLFCAAVFLVVALVLGAGLRDMVLQARLGPAWPAPTLNSLAEEHR